MILSRFGPMAGTKYNTLDCFFCAFVFYVISEDGIDIGVSTQRKRHNSPHCRYQQPRSNIMVVLLVDTPTTVVGVSSSSLVIQQSYYFTNHNKNKKLSTNNNNNNNNDDGASWTKNTTRCTWE